MRNHGGLLAGLAQAVFDAAGRADRHRRNQNHDLTVVAELGDLSGDLLHVLAGIFGDVNDFCALHHGFQMSGIHEPAGADTAANDVAQILFMEGKNAAGQQRGVARVAAVSNYRHSKVSKTGSYYSTQISATINADLHVVLLAGASPLTEDRAPSDISCRLH